MTTTDLTGATDGTDGVRPPDLSGLPGLEALRLIQAGGPGEPGAPFIGRLLGMRFDEVEHGRMVISLSTRPEFANPLGTVHGGIAATLLDSAMGCAVHTTLPAGVGYTTLELKVNYIRAADTRGQTLTAEGSVIHVGRSTATAEGRVHDENGRLIAHATTTCLILRPDGDAGR
ncbi:PaaI family thioesterase [Streptomyces sp. NPDC101249]|uniref:PaaI family thioesterase n=1 Tax=Streptomyces sp. NPDC101249 TaxID=3366140 RepID=UPI0037FC41C3